MNAFERKLLSFGAITPQEAAVLTKALRDVRTVAPGADVIREGDKPNDVNVVMSGFAFRYKDTLSGRRQIFAYLLPGDFCDLNVALLGHMDHSIGTLSPCEIAHIPRATILDLLQHPRIAHTLWMCNLVDAATLREWVLNVGQRHAEHRIAHLFCETYTRMKVVGLAPAKEFRLPIPQSALANTVGISDVHVNRSLRTLREKGLAKFHGGLVTIPDIRSLIDYAEFEPGYLHLRLRDQP